ncbi:hypothetical protein LJR039_003742 [Pseudorhodoferax sp. LjRoot39]|uniref:hypothetical protein n=1 Tax=Pseudorhodoferax sp. LjRoot39 TaxID=3342328 RepID=UPI003ED0C41D
MDIALGQYRMIHASRIIREVHELVVISRFSGDGAPRMCCAEMPLFQFGAWRAANQIYPLKSMDCFD